MKPTEAQKQAATEKRAKFRALCKQVAGMTDTERAALAERMPALVTCEGHALSAHNQILIAFQGGESCTILGGFHQWRKAGRCVKKGEHGFMIWVPSGLPKSEEAGNVEGADLHFLTAHLFDISQTEEVAETVAA